MRTLDEAVVINANDPRLTGQRTLRYADGPDEVHHHVIARHEVKTYKDSNSRQTAAKAHTEARGSAGFMG